MILENEIEKLEFEKSLTKRENIIFIEQSMANDIENYFHIEKNYNDLKLFLRKKYPIIKIEAILGVDVCISSHPSLYLVYLKGN